MGKTAKKTVKKTHRKRRRKSESFGRYIYQVLKQVHPGVGMSKKGMEVMNSFVFDMFTRLATSAGGLVRKAKASTITSREINTAIRLTLPGELAKHASSEACKAVAQYSRSANKKR